MYTIFLFIIESLDIQSRSLYKRCLQWHTCYYGKLIAIIPQTTREHNRRERRVGGIEIYRDTCTRDSSRINGGPIPRCLSLAIKHALRPRFVRAERQIYGYRLAYTCGSFQLIQTGLRPAPALHNSAATRQTGNFVRQTPRPWLPTPALSVSLPLRTNWKFLVKNEKGRIIGNSQRKRTLVYLAVLTWRRFSLSKSFKYRSHHKSF